MKPPLVRVRPTPLSLWYAVFAGPGVWSVHFLFSYLLSEKTCKLGPADETWFGVNQSKALAFSFTIVGLVAIIGALIFAIQRWRRVRTAHHEDAPPNGRDVFLAIYAIASNALFGLLVLTEGLPNLLLLPVCN